MKRFLGVMVIAGTVLAPMSFAHAEGEPADVAAPAAEAAPAIKPGSANDPNRMICRSESVTGSTLPKRVCMTAAQREQQRENARQALSSTQRRTGSYHSGG